MKLTVNGQEQEHPQQITGSGLLEALDIPASTVVVELNGDIIQRPAFMEHQLVDGDTIELVTLVGGG